MPTPPSRLLRAPWLIIAIVALATGFGLALGLSAILPPSEPGYPYIAIAASFMLNLAGLGLALVFLPAPDNDSKRFILAHGSAWVQASAAIFCAFAGLWAAPTQHESLRVFVALALLTSAQAAVLCAVHAGLSVVFGTRSRAPNTCCVILLGVLVSALFWSREPIERLARNGGNGSQQSAQLVDGIMKLSPPMAVGSAWYQESDSARNAQTSSARRFDLVHGPLTYAVWIGSYQTAACPDILPTLGSGDFYSRTDFKAGLVLLLLLWAMPIILLCDVLLWWRSSRAGKMETK